MIMDRKLINSIYKILTFVIIFIFCTIIAKSIILTGTNSDMANMVLRSYDILNGDIFCRNWHELVFYSTDLLFYTIVTAITGIAPKTVFITTFLMIIFIYFSSVLLIKDKDNHLDYKFILLLLLLLGININLYVHTPAFAYSFICVFFLDRYFKNKLKKDFSLMFLFMFLALLGDKLVVPILILPVLIYCTTKIAYTNEKSDKTYLNVIYSILGLFVLFYLLSKIFALCGINIYDRDAGQFAFVTLFTTIENFKMFLLQLLILFRADFFNLPIGINAAGALVKFGIMIAGYVLSYNEIKSMLTNKKTTDLISAILSLGIIILSFIMLTTNINNDIFHFRYIAYFPFAFAVLICRKMFSANDKFFILTLLVLFITSGQQLQITKAPLIISIDTRNIITYLQNNNLTNGLATFWNASDIVLNSKNTIKLRSFEIINGEIIQRATSTNYKWYDEEFNYILLRQKDEVSLNELPKPDETIYFDNYIICKYAQPVKIKKLRK